MPIMCAKPAATIHDTLAQLADAHGGVLSVGDLQQVLVTMQYTGVLVLHYRGGKAAQVELGRPTSLTLG